MTFITFARPLRRGFRRMSWGILAYLFFVPPSAGLDSVAGRAFISGEKDFWMAVGALNNPASS